MTARRTSCRRPLRAGRAALALALAGLCAGGGCVGSAQTSDTTRRPRRERTVAFEYRFEVCDLQADARRIVAWIPLPAESDRQRVSGLRLEADGPWEVVRDPEYGNRFARIDLSAATGRAIRQAHGPEHGRGASPAAALPQSDGLELTRDLDQEGQPKAAALPPKRNVKRLAWSALAALGIAGVAVALYQGVNSGPSRLIIWAPDLSKWHITLDGEGTYRTVTEGDLELPPGVVVFFGPNAQGKSTLLEAAYILAIARSFRAENEREVINFHAAAEGGEALVGGTVEKADGRIAVYVGYRCTPAPEREGMGHPGPGPRGYSVRKEIRVSRVRRTASELVGMVNCVLFSAEDIQLVQGPPTGRRRYLDVLISQADPLYIKGLQRYQRVVQQRNQLLRMLREGRAASNELAFWDDELVREGAWVTWRRHEVLRELSAACAQRHQELSGAKEDLLLEYRPSVPLGDGLTATEEGFRQSLAAGQQRERAVATTLVGPHRDDFDLLVGEVDMSTFASRGQARTLALTLRLGEAAYLASARDEGPILLLDDVLSEMDASRRRRVLQRVSQYQQVLITTTDVELVRDFFGPAATYYKVDGGSVCPLADDLDDAAPGRGASPA